MTQGQGNRSRNFPSSSLTPERLPRQSTESAYPSYQSSSTLASGSGTSSHQSPYSKSRPRSRSAGEDSFGHSSGGDRTFANSVSSWESPVKGGWVTVDADSDSPGQVEERDEDVADLLNTVHGMLLRLQELAAWSKEQTGSNWKGKQAERGEEAWDVISSLTAILKRSPRVRREAPVDDLVDS